MIRSVFRLTAAAAATAVIAAVTLFSSVKIAEKIEKELDESKKKNEEDSECEDA